SLLDHLVSERKQFAGISSPSDLGTQKALVRTCALTVTGLWIGQRFDVRRGDQGEECDRCEPPHRCTRGDPILRHSGAFALISCLHHSIRGLGSLCMGAICAGVVGGGGSGESGSSGATAMGGATLRGRGAPRGRSGAMMSGGTPGGA